MPMSRHKLTGHGDLVVDIIPGNMGAALVGARIFGPDGDAISWPGSVEMIKVASADPRDTSELEVPGALIDNMVRFKLLFDIVQISSGDRFGDLGFLFSLANGDVNRDNFLMQPGTAPNSFYLAEFER